MNDQSETKERAHRLFQQAWQENDENGPRSALALIEEALDLNPSISIYWTTKCQFLYKLREFGPAEEAAKRALELKSDNHHAWLLLGNIRGEQRRFKSAVEAFKKGVELNPAFNTYTMLAAAQLWVAPADAVTSARKALELNPEWDEAKVILEQALKLVKSGGKQGSGS